MNERDLLKAFRDASWDREEQDIFIYLATEQKELLSARVVVQLLEILCNKRYSAEIHAHRKRCYVFSRLLSGTEDRQLFVPFVQAIRDGDNLLREVLVPLLPRVNNFQEHPKLCSLLRAREAEVRRAAAEVLKAVGGRTVLRVLNEMVLERDFPGRSEVIDVVLPVAGHHALSTLEAVVAVGTAEEKCKALGYLGDPHYMMKSVPDALRVIRCAFDDPQEKVVSQAIRAFCSHCNEDGFFEHVGPFLDSSQVSLAIAAVAGLRRFQSSKTIAALERKLRTGPNPVRMEVLDVLEAIGSDVVLPPLVEAVGHRLLVVRQRASQVLSALSLAGKIDLARTIIWLLRSRDTNVRRIATDLMQTVRDPTGEVWPRLIGFLRDEDWWVRERVMDALVEMAGRQLTPYLVKYLVDRSDVIRRFAVDALIRLGDPRSFRALATTAQEDEDWWTREKAIEAIAAIGDQRALIFLSELLQRKEDAQLACMRALKEMNGEETVPFVAELLASPDRDIRLEALKFLDHFGAVQYSRKVQQLLADPDLHVAREAKQILLHWKVDLSREILGSSIRSLSVLDRMLVAIAEAGADDLILVPGSTPFMKRLDRVTPLSTSVMSADQIVAILTPVLTLTQHEKLRSLADLDFSYEVRAQELRFRANIFHQRGGLGGVFRIIKGEAPRLEKLGLPQVVTGFSQLQYGLVLVGGPTGSGKSTTLSAIIDDINRNQARHVISLEDPIEVVHGSQQGLVNQREVGTHTQSFQTALRSTLRQDPDVILVGEMRDLDTIRFAITAADTGHLVFGTVHTVSADTTVDRLLNAFPPKEQDQMRSSLANNLRAVVCQYLLKKKDGTGRVLAAEVMINNEAVANLIRKGQAYQLPSIIATSQEQGMQLMDNELMRLYREGVISGEMAYMKANVKSHFADLVNEQDAVPAVTGEYTLVPDEEPLSETAEDLGRLLFGSQER